MGLRRSTNASDDIGAEVAALKRQLADLAASIEASARADGGDIVRSIGERARDFLRQATSFVDNVSHDIRDVAKDSTHTAMSRIRSTAHEGTEQLEDVIRQRPLTSVILALGVGCLLSMMLHRR